MKIYKTLSINGKTETLVELLIEWKKLKYPNWQYDKDASDDYASNIFVKRERIGCFTYTSQGNNTAKLWIVISKGNLAITNITPLKITKLEKEEYNKIFDDFYNSYIESLRIVEKYDVNVVVKGPELSIVDMANEQTANALVCWESGCNQENGNLHTSDEQKWFDFVIAAANTNSPLTSDELGRWLLEDKKWYNEDTVDRLQGEYENERRLLEYYKKRKRK